VRLAFYFALRDTVVADSLDQASRIAYGKDKRWGRVVTIKVWLIQLWPAQKAIASITTSVFYFDRSVTGECHLGCLAAGSENLWRCMAFDLAGSCPHASGFGRPPLHYKANALYYKF
jgi:hypothetical protein